MPSLPFSPKIRRDSFHLTDSRDDGSNFTDFAYLNTDDDKVMDEIIIQRYLSERNKLKMSEARNQDLVSQLNDVISQAEMSTVEAERTIQTTEMKLEQQEKMTESLHCTIQNLQSQFSRQALETGDQIKAVRDESDSQIVALRKESDAKVVAMRDELMELEASYKSTRKTIKQEKERYAELTAKYNAIEESSRECEKMLNEEKLKSAAIQHEANNLEEKSKDRSIDQETKVQSLLERFKKANEDLEFERERAENFSNELKLISYQFVESQEKLIEGQSILSKQSKELDSLEKELKKEKQKSVLLSNQLEEMAKGYIELDESNAKEKRSSELLTKAVSALKAELSKEKEVSEACAGELLITEKSYLESQEELKNKTKTNQSLLNELISIKELFSAEETKSSTLAQQYNDTQNKFDEMESNYKVENERANTLCNELDLLKKSHVEATHDLGTSQVLIKELHGRADSLTKKLQAQNEESKRVQATLGEEKGNFLSRIEEVDELNKALAHEVTEYKQACEEQTDSLTKVQEELKELQSSYSALWQNYDATEKECIQLKLELQQESEENEEKTEENKERIASLSGELESMEKKYTSLFDSLVDTEDELKTKKQELGMLKMQLDTKEDEFRPVEEMLRKEIQTRDLTINEYQEKNLASSTELVDLNKKCNEMYSNLVVAEEKVLEMQEESTLVANELTAKEQGLKTLELLLEKEKNGPHQRKLKVAKKMIQGEKNRHKKLMNDIKAKDLIIKREETLSNKLFKELHETKELLENEREKKSTHSGRTLQELHRQLEEERKNVQSDKEQLRALLKAEKTKVKSLSARMRAIEESSGEEALSIALKEQHQYKDQVQGLLEENQRLKEVTEKATNTEALTRNLFDEKEAKYKKLLDSMDTLTKYCSGLENEKKALLDLQNSSRRNLFDLLENDDSSSRSGEDDDTVSLSDFSIANVPRNYHVAKKTQIKYMSTDPSQVKNRQNTSISEKSSSEQIELTFDTSAMIY